jgi:predicted dinucleotide-binding enzyme
MRIGVLGTGEVGRVLGAGFVSHGHQVMIGSRDPKQEKVQAWIKSSGAAASAGTFAEAPHSARLGCWASWTESSRRSRSRVGAARRESRDRHHEPLDSPQGVPPRRPSRKHSAEETVRRRLRHHAFNIVGNPHMVHPQFPGGPPDMFICGDDDAAKETVTGLLKSFGWPVIDLGGIASSRYLEAMAMVWILYFFKTGTGNHAFKMLSK